MRHSFRYGLDYRPAGPYRSQMQTEAPTGRDSNVADRISPRWGCCVFTDDVTQGSTALRPGLSNPAPLGLKGRLRDHHCMTHQG